MNTDQKPFIHEYTRINANQKSSNKKKTRWHRRVVALPFKRSGAGALLILAGLLLSQLLGGASHLELEAAAEVPPDNERALVGV